MPGIILTFDTESNKIIKDIYNNINNNENLINIDSTPHISLMRIHKEFDQDDINLIDKNIENISKNFKNLDIKIEGIGYFKNKNDKFVLFFIPVYDENMQKIHKYLWKLIEKKIKLLDENHYSPLNFSPHITIPMNDNNKNNLLKILNLLSDVNTRISIKTNEIAFIDSNKIYTSKKLK
tara:strand:+ start:3058 stop:3594 length:537 start_codon:yes stop_codon:yes gene_type:complete